MMLSSSIRAEGNAAMTDERVTMREVVRLLLKADSYLRPGNEDWAIAARMEAAALAKAETAIGSPDDPPEFARWLEALQRRDLPADGREEIYWAMTILPRKAARG
jgi:hypothetical protein